MENNKWKPHEDFVEELLNLPEKFIWVDKLPQVGLTTSLGRVCLRKGLKFTHFAPTNKIIDDTLGNRIMQGEPYGKIGSNKELCKNKTRNPLFDMYHTRCRDCVYLNTHECGYKRIADIDYPAYGITYPKFRILTLPAPMGYCRDEIRNKIFNTDVILLDEFARLIVFEPQGFFVEDLTDAVSEINKRDRKNEIRPELLEMLNNFGDAIQKVEMDKKHNDTPYGICENKELTLFKAGYLGAESLNTMEELKEKVKKFWGYKNENLRKIMERITLSMTYPEMYVYKKECKAIDSEGIEITIMKPYAFPAITHPFYEVLKPYLDDFNGKVIATGMILPGFETLPWHKVTMPDFNKTESMHLVVCDTKKFWFKRKEFCTADECVKFDDWGKHKEEIKDLILNVKRRFKNLNVIVFAFNKNVYEELESWRKSIIQREPLAERILIEKSYCFTYYRSDLGSGVNLSAYPIKFYLGAADTPQNAYAESDLLYDVPQEKMRLVEMADTFMNALGRGKDPEGKNPSISFIIGARKEDVLELIPKDKQEYYNIISVYTEGTIYDVCNIFADYWFIQKIWGTQFSLNDLPKIVDIFKVATEKAFTTIRQIQGRWSNKPDKPNANDLRRLCRYLPINNFEFDGRAIRNKGFFKKQN